MPIFLILILNIFIIRYFIKKLKSKNLVKNDFINEKKAIACTISINSNLLLTQSLLIIIHPFYIYDFEFAKYKFVSMVSYIYTVLNPLIVFHFNNDLKKIFYKRS